MPEAQAQEEELASSVMDAQDALARAGERFRNRRAADAIAKNAALPETGAEGEGDFAGLAGNTALSVRLRERYNPNGWGDLGRKVRVVGDGKPTIPYEDASIKTAGNRRKMVFDAALRNVREQKNVEIIDGQAYLKLDGKRHKITKNGLKHGFDRRWPAIMNAMANIGSLMNASIKVPMNRDAGIGEYEQRLAVLNDGVYRYVLITEVNNGPIKEVADVLILDAINTKPVYKNEGARPDPSSTSTGASAPRTFSIANLKEAWEGIFLGGMERHLEQKAKPKPGLITIPPANTALSVGAWAGARRSFRQADLEKVGSGEGGQMFGWGIYGGGVEAIGVSYMHDRAGEADTDVLINGESLFDMAERGDYSDIWYGPIDFDPYIEAIGDEAVANRISDSFIEDGLVPINDDQSIKDAAWRWSEMIDEEYGAGSPESRYAEALAGSIRGGEAVMRMRLFTNRADGDDSHLLDWRHPLTEVNRGRVLKTLEDLMAKHGVGEQKMADVFGKGWRELDFTGQNAYYMVTDFFEHMVGAEDPKRSASEALYEHDIDGVRYEAGEVQGKPDDAEPAYDYVAFSDEYIEVEAIGRENANGEIEWEELGNAPGNTALSSGSRMGKWEADPGFAEVRPAEVGRQKRAGAYYPDIGAWLANTAFSMPMRWSGSWESWTSWGTRRRRRRRCIGSSRADCSCRRTGRSLPRR